MLADTTKATAKSTARNRSVRTFKVSKFQIPSSALVEVSGEESDGGSGKKNSGKMTQSVQKKSENTKPTKVEVKGKRKRKTSVTGTKKS